MLFCIQTFAPSSQAAGGVVTETYNVTEKKGSNSTVFFQAFLLQQGGELCASLETVNQVGQCFTGLSSPGVSRSAWQRAVLK